MRFDRTEGLPLPKEPWLVYGLNEETPTKYETNHWLFRKKKINGFYVQIRLRWFQRVKTISNMYTYRDETKLAYPILGLMVRIPLGQKKRVWHRDLWWVAVHE